MSADAVEKGGKWVAQMMEEKQIAAEKGTIPRGEWRRIIMGKTYNSATASQIASFSHVCDPSDIYGGTVFESLHQTRGGAFILVGDGDHGSPYRRHATSSNDIFGGCAYIPLSESEAKQWMEIRGLTEEYEEVFGLPEEAGETRSEFLVRLPPALVRRVSAAASSGNMSVSAWIQSLIEKAVAPQG
jgi:predicted HicB family RNase H-like nuclease